MKEATYLSIYVLTNVNLLWGLSTEAFNGQTRITIEQLTLWPSDTLLLAYLTYLPYWVGISTYVYNQFFILRYLTKRSTFDTITTYSGR